MAGEPLELAAGATVGDAVAALATRHDVVARLRDRFRVAVNQAIVGDDHALADGDELALIPPVAGGAAHVVLSADAVSLDRCIAAVTGAGMGGIVTFVGMVRRDGRAGVIDHLEYEAYAAMATAVMTELCVEIEGELPGVRLAVEHRVGRLAIGDVAVVIAAAAPHRAEAFAACRSMIDRLKDRVPIWKKEVGVDGAEWVGLGP
jgi:molybdopterin synthase catalytic subunit